MVGTQTGHIKVVESVVVVVANRHAHTPTDVGHSRLIGDVGKRPVAIVVIEGAFGSLVRLEQIHGQRVEKKNVQIAVVVIIKERYSSAHRLDYIFLFR